MQEGGRLADGLSLSLAVAWTIAWTMVSGVVIMARVGRATELADRRMGELASIFSSPSLPPSSSYSIRQCHSALRKRHSVASIMVRLLSTLVLLAPAALAAQIPFLARPSAELATSVGSHLSPILNPDTDDWINDVLKTWKAPGVAVAVVRMDDEGVWKVSSCWPPGLVSSACPSAWYSPRPAVSPPVPTGRNERIWDREPQGKTDDGRRELGPLSCVPTTYQIAS